MLSDKSRLGDQRSRQRSSSSAAGTRRKPRWANNGRNNCKRNIMQNRASWSKWQIRDNHPETSLLPLCPCTVIWQMFRKLIKTCSICWAMLLNSISKCTTRILHSLFSSHVFEISLANETAIKFTVAIITYNYTLSFWTLTQLTHG